MPIPEPQVTSLVFSDGKNDSPHFTHQANTIDGGISKNGMAAHLPGCPCGNGYAEWTAKEYQENCWDHRRGTNKEIIAKNRIPKKYHNYYWTKIIKHPIICYEAEALIHNGGTNNDDDEGTPHCLCRNSSEESVNQYISNNIRFLIEFEYNDEEGFYCESIDDVVIEDQIKPIDKSQHILSPKIYNFKGKDYSGFILQRDRESDSSFGDRCSWINLSEDKYDDRCQHLFLVDKNIASSKCKKLTELRDTFELGDELVTINGIEYTPYPLKSGTSSSDWNEYALCKIEELNKDFKVEQVKGIRYKKKTNFAVTFFDEQFNEHNAQYYPNPLEPIWIQLTNLRFDNPYFEKESRITLRVCYDGKSETIVLDGCEYLIEYEIETKTSQLWIKIPSGLPESRFRFEIDVTSSDGNNLGDIVHYQSFKEVLP